MQKFKLIFITFAAFATICTNLVSVTAANAVGSECPDRLLYANKDLNRNASPYGLVASTGGGYKLPSISSLSGTTGCTSNWTVTGSNNYDAYFVFDDGNSVFDAGTDDITYTFTVDTTANGGGFYHVYGLDVFGGTNLSLSQGTESYVGTPTYSDGYGGTFIQGVNNVTMKWHANSTQAANLRAGGKFAILMTIVGSDYPGNADTLGSAALQNYVQPTPVSLSFNANGGSGTLTDQSSYGYTEIKANTFARSGFTFTGWNTEMDGSGDSYADLQQFPFIASDTLFAQWLADSGGSGNDTSSSDNSENPITKTKSLNLVFEQDSTKLTKSETKKLEEWVSALPPKHRIIGFKLEASIPGKIPNTQIAIRRDRSVKKAIRNLEINSDLDLEVNRIGIYRNIVKITVTYSKRNR